MHSWASGQAGFSFPKTKGSASGLQEGAEANGEWTRPGGGGAGEGVPGCPSWPGVSFPRWKEERAQAECR